MEDKQKDTYAAGFFDGEGTVYIANTKGRWLFSVSVVNTNREVIDWFHITYGGKKYNRPAKGNWKKRYSWYSFGKEAVTFLRQISPYVIVKRLDVQLGIAFGETLRSDNKPISSEVTGSRVHLLGEIRQLRRAATTESESPCGGHRVKRQSELMGNHERGDRSISPATESGQ